MTEETYIPHPMTLLAGLLAVALGVVLLWDQMAPAGDPAAPWAAPVPTLMPTPALVVPTPVPAPVAPPPPVYVERVESGGQVTVNQTTVDVDVCISLFCD